jgi:hypothetical protein
VKKNYQNDAVSATAPVLPEAVSVVMAELAGDVQEGCSRWPWALVCR